MAEVSSEFLFAIVGLAATALAALAWSLRTVITINASFRDVLENHFSEHLKAMIAITKIMERVDTRLSYWEGKIKFK